jgi:isocitrate dehydrogenase
VSEHSLASPLSAPARRAAAGIEFQQGSADAEKFAKLLKDNFPERFKKARTRGGALGRAGVTLTQPAWSHTWWARWSRWRGAHAATRTAQVRFPGSSGYGIKAVSREGTERLMEARARACCRA